MTFAALFILVLNLSWAQSTESLPSSDSLALPKSEVAPKTPTRLRVHGEIGTESIQYPTAIAGRPQLSQNNSFEAFVKMEFENSWSEGRLQFQGAKSGHLNSQYIAVQEAYLGTSGGTGISLGRKIYFWNQADEDWNLGLWQPLHLEDGLRPVPQGLTGLFYNSDGPMLQFLAFASPLFIPTMSPALAEQNGELVSESRWFRPLPRRVSVMEAKPTELVYRMKVPNARDLVLQASYGARLRVGSADRGPWVAVAYAQKPINSLFVKYDASVIARGLNPLGQIEVGPIVARHELASADLGWNFEKVRLGISYLQDVPGIRLPENSLNSEGFQSDYYQQQPRPLRVASMHLNSSFDIPLLERELTWKILYLRARTEETSEFDSQGVERSAFIPNRLNFTNAAVLQTDLKWNFRWTTTFKYLREFDQLGSIWNFETEFKPGRWAFRLGIDVLGVDDEIVQEGDNRFINAYRQNDRVYGGLAYVF